MAGPQLALDFPVKQNREATDFLVASCNEVAFRFVKNWRNWASPVAILTGGPQSGKSHLARIWQTETNARLLRWENLGDEIEAFTASGNILIEDADTFRGEENAFFHLLNLAREHYTSIMMTARAAPGHWDVRLPDLRSRLRSYPTVQIEEPDDALLAGILVKLFDDRQLAVSPDLIPFVLTRVERSMQAIFDFVDRLDRSAMAEHRKVTRSFVASFLRRDDAARLQP